ncbi:MAG: hypothetical protein JWR72_422 [Flavisolibacter sp.]|nr:hypothetical protein [Flavisolibacter sp.]
MEQKITSLKRTARVTGLLYLIMILTSVYAHVYVPLQIFVKGDAVATTRNILANEFLFRTCIVVSLIETIIFLFLVLNLYQLFKGVNNHLARLMVALVAVQIPVAFVLGTLKLTSLLILKNELSFTVPPSELPNLAMLFLETTRNGNTILALSGGLWLFPFGLLVYKSRFIPRIFGVLLVSAGTGYIAGSLLSMLLPGYTQPQVLPFIFFGVGEISIVLWLLIKGAKDYVSIEVIAETKTTIRPSIVKIKEYTE